MDEQDPSGSEGGEPVGTDPLAAASGPASARRAPTHPSALYGPLAMVRVGRGDRDAFEAVYDALKDDIHAFLARMVVDAEAAEDLLQETFLRVYREASRYDPCRPLEPWVFRIARNLAVDHLRGRKRRGLASLTLSEDHTLEAEAPGPDPLDRAAAREREALLREGLSRLRPSQREILIMVDLEGLKYEEVAARLGISVKAVGARLRKARRRFMNWARPHEAQLVGRPEEDRRTSGSGDRQATPAEGSRWGG